MEIFERVNSVAKAAADRTTEIVEEAHLKAQIRSDEKSIRELEAKIGAHYYQKFVNKESVDDEILKYCTAITVHLENIKEKKAALSVEPATKDFFEQ